MAGAKANFTERYKIVRDHQALSNHMQNRLREAEEQDESDLSPAVRNTGKTVQADLTRLVVVYSVAAFDQYFTDKFADHVITFIKLNGGITEGLKKWMEENDIEMTEIIKILLTSDTGARPLRRIRSVVDEKLSKLTTTVSGKIEDLFAVYGMKNLYKHTVSKINKKRQRNLVDKNIDDARARRNDIAHACDVVEGGKQKNITASKVAKWVDSIEQFVNNFDEMFDKEFSKIKQIKRKTKKKVSKKKTKVKKKTVRKKKV